MNATQTTFGDAIRQCLIDLDVNTIRKIGLCLDPNFPRDASDEEMVATLHYARTLAASVEFPLRAYSHAWLTERGVRSGLPDDLRPAAQRMYPRVADAVGVAVLATSHVQEERRFLGMMVREAMNGVVMDHYSTDRPRASPQRIHDDMVRKRADVWRDIFNKSVGWRK